MNINDEIAEIKNTIAERIKEQMRVNEIDQKTLAAKTGLLESSISYYLRAERECKASGIVLIAKALDVSTDYLLGLTDTSTPDADTRAVCDYTGLDEISVENLHSCYIMTAISDSDEYNRHVDKLKYEIINRFLEDEYYWSDLVSILIRYENRAETLIECAERYEREYKDKEELSFEEWLFARGNYSKLKDEHAEMKHAIYDMMEVLNKIFKPLYQNKKEEAKKAISRIDSVSIALWEKYYKHRHKGDLNGND